MVPLVAERIGGTHERNTHMPAPRHTREHYGTLVAHYLSEHHGISNADTLVSLMRKTVDAYWATGTRVRTCGDRLI